MTTKTLFTALLLAGLFTVTAQAQSATNLFQSYVPTADAIDVDLTDMNTNDLVALSDEQVQALRSESEQTKEEALQNVIYLGTHFKETLNTGRATTHLYEIYRLDRNEQLRIMALAGLHAIGSDNIMRQLSQDVQLERSDRIRHLTNAALIDYFGAEVN